MPPQTERKTVDQMQQDLLKFRESKYGTPTSSSTPTAPTVPPPAPAPAAPRSDIEADLQNFRSGVRAEGPARQRPEVPKDPNALAEFAKGIFSAPATIVARPFQAVAAVAGASNDQIDEFTNRIPVLGDLIQDAPDTFGDVKKDVGRAAQTVALGSGAPIAGGALFGAGASLEQGNDLLSAETAFQTVLGGGVGKVATLVGKPLLNASGKVVGVITPQTLKDVAARGAGAIQAFAKNHQLLGGIAAKPSEALAKGLQAVDDRIMHPFGGAAAPGSGVGGVLAREYPHLNPRAHYQKVNARDIAAPTTINEPKYAKATRVYTDAQNKGINLEEVANKRGIIHDKIAEGGRYNTLDTVENLRQSNYEVSNRIARPAIKAAEPGVRLVPVSEIRRAMLRQVDEIPPSQITAEDRAWMRNQINRRYADGSAAALENPNGYSLTSLHDSRIVSQQNGGYKMGQSASDARKAQLSREEGRVFAKIFDDTIPEEVGMKEFRKELEETFLLADYLESLHNKAVPQNITKKAVRLFGKAIAATVGGKIGGWSGGVLGAQYGDMAFSAFQTLPNPIKMRVLESIKIEDPKIFKEIIEYIGEQEAARLMRPLLPPAGSSSFRPQNPTLFTTPGGVTTPNKGEAFDISAVEGGAARTGSSLSGKRLKDLIQGAQENMGPYVPPGELPVIRSGRVPKKPKNLNDIFID